MTWIWGRKVKGQGHRLINVFFTLIVGHNSKMNNPKVFKLGLWNDLEIF